jgi:hypothetical protein
MDTLDFAPVIQTRASAVDKQHEPVIMIAEIGPRESGPPIHLHPRQVA